MTQAGGLEDSDFSVDRLLLLLSSLSGNEKRRALQAAIRAVLAQQEGDARAPEGSVSSGDAATCLSDGTAGAPCERPRPQEDVLPDFNACLDAYPRCQGLVNAFRLNRNTQNKTPLSIVHEYATRLGLELTYVESAESQLGPFTVEAKLTSVGGGVLYACGSGRGRGKKDAKQVAAAALLESLLNLGGQTEADFLQPGKAKLQKAVQAKAQRRWQSGRARLADCKAHVLPSYSASGLQFIGDSMCRANALFEPHLGALAASDALAANAVSGFSDAQHSLLGSSFYTGGALTTSEPGVAAGGLPLADFDTSAKLAAHHGLFAGEPFSSDAGFGWGAATESAADNGYAHSALPLASEGFAQCAPLLQGFSMPFSPASFPCQLPY